MALLSTNAEYYAANRDRLLEQKREYYKANRAKILAKNEAWRRANPAASAEKDRRASLRRNFGLSLEQYAGMLAAQGGRCAMLGCVAVVGDSRGGQLAVDHDHVTGKIRALLCSRCNGDLGVFETYRLPFERYLSRTFAPWGLVANSDCGWKKDSIRQLKRRFSLNPATYEAKFRDQGGVCSLCAAPPKLLRRHAVDHDHSTGILRDILCEFCNRKVGMFELRQAAFKQYLVCYG